MDTGCIVVGTGELGSLFARGALRAGYPVFPVRREEQDYRELEDRVALGLPVLLTVGEADMASALKRLGSERARDVILVQNELFPEVWRPYVEHPTVAVVWTAAKPDIPLLVGKETVVYGPHAEWFAEIHEPLGLHARVASDEQELHAELAAKYAFILTINILGLKIDATVRELFENFRDETDDVLIDAIRLAESRLGHSVEENAVIDAVLDASRGLGSMRARGRSAPARLERSLQLAEEQRLEVPAVQAIAAELE